MKKKMSLDGSNINVGISIGVATRTATMAGYPDLLKAADQALYAAKRSGRRAVRMADPDNVKKEDSSVITDNANRPSTAANAPAPANQPPIDVAAVLKRCGGDPSFAAAVTERFRVQAGDEVAKIEQALAASDAPTLCRAAHSLKSMAAYMGAECAVTFARQIEDLGHANRLDETGRPLGLLRQEIERAIAWITQANAAPQSTPVRRAS